MHQGPENIEEMLNNSTILIHFDDFYRCLYILTTEVYVFQLFEPFFLSLSSRQRR